MNKIFLKIENFLSDIATGQTPKKTLKEKKQKGIFYTTTFDIIDEILSVLPPPIDILQQNILEPSCGNGIFILAIISRIFKKFPDEKVIYNFIENYLIFCDIDQEAIDITKKNINNLFKILFLSNYKGKYNGFVCDFTQKIATTTNLLFDNISSNPLNKYINKIDLVIGNPPFVSLYGRRGKKKSEEIRQYYLDNYKQFPNSLKNGKINYIMLFIENALDLLVEGGKISFIIDISFFETPFLHTRKYLLENTKINRLIYNINEFNVGSGQLIIEIEKIKSSVHHKVIITDYSKKYTTTILQRYWYDPLKEYKFTILLAKKTREILQKITDTHPIPLISLYPNKNLRTCVMALDMEKKFLYNNIDITKRKYFFRYYKGSSGLKEKYGKFYFDNYFYFDVKLQKEINDKLKIILTKEGIKNKKRIGLGEMSIYKNPKLFIRQSAKEIVASYDEERSASNNSLYVFSLRSDSEFARNELLYICGILNSTLTTFFCQNNQIIRYVKGKQPQIKISDLYKIPIPQNNELKQDITQIVKQYYNNKIDYKNLMQKVDSFIFNFYKINNKEINYIIEEILNF